MGAWTRHPGTLRVWLPLIPDLVSSECILVASVTLTADQMNSVFLFSQCGGETGAPSLCKLSLKLPYFFLFLSFLHCLLPPLSVYFFFLLLSYPFFFKIPNLTIKLCLS